MINQNQLLLLASVVVLSLVAFTWLLFQPQHPVPAPVDAAYAARASISTQPSSADSDESRTDNGQISRSSAPIDISKAAARPQAASQVEAPAVPAPTPTLVPIVFVPPEPNDFTAEQLHVLQGLQKDFVTALQKPRLDPNSPAYLDWWKKCEGDFDEQFRIQFGDEAELKYKMLANQVPVK